MPADEPLIPRRVEQAMQRPPTDNRVKEWWDPVNECAVYLPWDESVVRTPPLSTMTPIEDTHRMTADDDFLHNPALRKEAPMARGVLDYFPDALAAVAHLSKVGNDKHNPGQPLHWSREKSSDHADCIMRHLAGRGTIDPEDDILHDVKVAWRALALCQLALEKRRAGGCSKS